MWTRVSPLGREKSTSETTLKHRRLYKPQVLASLCQFQVQVWDARVGTLYLSAHTLLTRHLTFLPHAEQTGATSRWYRAMPRRSGQAASSYNNIALWRSPERTGKCCLCAPSGRGGAGAWGWRGGWEVCLYSPNNSLAMGLEERRLKKGPGRGSKGPCYTCLFHLWG